MLMSQCIANDAVEGRKTRARTYQQHRLVFFPGHIKALTRRTEHTHSLAHTRFIVQPSAHSSAGDPSDVQLEFTILRQTRDRIATRKTVLTHYRDILPRPETDGRIAPKAYLQD